MENLPDRPSKIANLPWYDLTEIRSFTDALWQEIACQFRRRGITGTPDRLTRDMHYADQWLSTDFLFGQACGYDVLLSYADQLQLVATPRYDMLGCQGTNYSSFVTVKADSDFFRFEDLRGQVCAINTPTSHSGMNVLRALAAAQCRNGPFFSKVHQSGAHEQSLRWLQQGTVDVAAIDCVTYGLLARHRPDAIIGTRVIQQTAQAPAPPYVTSAAMPLDVVDLMRKGLAAALDNPRLEPAKAELSLSGIEIIPIEEYAPIGELRDLAKESNAEKNSHVF